MKILVRSLEEFLEAAKTAFEEKCSSCDLELDEKDAPDSYPAIALFHSQYAGGVDELIVQFVYPGDALPFFTPALLKLLEQAKEHNEALGLAVESAIECIRHVAGKPNEDLFKGTPIEETIRTYEIWTKPGAQGGVTLIATVEGTDWHSALMKKSADLALQDDNALKYNPRLHQWEYKGDAVFPGRDAAELYTPDNIRHELWTEGYKDSEGIREAHFWGYVVGPTFFTGVKRFVESISNPNERNLWSEKEDGSWHFWQCRVFNNEQAARKQFG